MFSIKNESARPQTECKDFSQQCDLGTQDHSRTPIQVTFDCGVQTNMMWRFFENEVLGQNRGAMIDLLF